MMYEGPSSDDIERFSHETGYCPSCGDEIWDDVDRCPNCDEWISGRITSRHPEAAAMRKRLYAAIGIIALVSFLVVLGFIRIF